MSGVYGSGDPVYLRFPVTPDGVLLHDGDPTPEEEWPWLPGVVVDKVVGFHGAGCDAWLDAAGECACPPVEYVVDVVDDRLLEIDEDGHGTYPVCFRTAVELLPRSIR